MLIDIKRIYDRADIIDGKRILIDRLWPRGVKRSTANIDLWLKDVAPSDELRKWFNHTPDRWVEFKKRYGKELETNKAFLELLHILKLHDVTLLYASNDAKRNNAVALAHYLKHPPKAVLRYRI